MASSTEILEHASRIDDFVRALTAALWDFETRQPFVIAVSDWGGWNGYRDDWEALLDGPTWKHPLTIGVRKQAPGRALFGTDIEWLFEYHLAAEQWEARFASLYGIRAATKLPPRKTTAELINLPALGSELRFDLTLGAVALGAVAAYLLVKR